MADAVLITPPGPMDGTDWHEAGQLADSVDSLLQENEAGENVYVGANPRTQEGGKYAT